MNYETATDFQLEDRLADLVGYEPSDIEKMVGSMVSAMQQDEDPLVKRSVFGMKSSSSPNYCTDWNATMPLAVEHGLDIELPIACLGGIGQITKYIAGDTDIMVDFVIGYNPLRAIVICLIKVLESKQ